MPKPSPPAPPGGRRLGMTKTRARSSQASRCASLTAPAKCTASRDAKLAWPRASSSGRSGPSPTTTQRAPGTRARISGQRLEHDVVALVAVGQPRDRDDERLVAIAGSVAARARSTPGSMTTTRRLGAPSRDGEVAGVAAHDDRRRGRARTPVARAAAAPDPRRRRGTRRPAPGHAAREHRRGRDDDVPAQDRVGAKGGGLRERKGVERRQPRAAAARHGGRAANVEAAAGVPPRGLPDASA